MEVKFVLFFIVLAAFYAVNAKPNFKKETEYKKFKNIYGKQHGNIKEGDAGDPLILTDLIEQGKIDEAKQAAKVDFEEFLGVESYSGFFRVDKKFDSNLYFWFFPSESNTKNSPVLVWLQGGPGSSSMYGLFIENGPLQFNKNGKLELRPDRWTKESSVLYFDQPVGTGFSNTKGGQAQNQTKVGEDLYEALQQFFKLFPEYQSNDFFLTGESYAGKYVPAIGHAIWKNNPTADLKINLKGLAIGNGWSVPEVQLRYADFLYSHGFIDRKVRAQMDDLESQAVKLIQDGKYAEAGAVMNQDFGGFLSLFSMNTGFSNVYNYLDENMDNTDDENINSLFSREDVRKALHVGNVPYEEDDVYYNLAEDIPKSVAPLLEDLINNYRVLLYSGQLDLIVPYYMTLEYVNNLKFNGDAAYKDADRTVWFYGDNYDRVAGYVKSFGNFTEVLVRNAGHMVPKDQPAWAFQLIDKFVRNRLIE